MFRNIKFCDTYFFFIVRKNYFNETYLADVSIILGIDLIIGDFFNLRKILKVYFKILAKKWRFF